MYEERNCYGKFNLESKTCRSQCPTGADCYRMLIKVSRVLKTTNIESLVIYLTDNNSVVREAAKERFDKLEEKYV